jgi:16S rRNA (adenine1518-N6/adenine1519-N6)-dimethyltransferase
MPYIGLPKKSLGQHWLNDQLSLIAICDLAELTPQDTVLEIGPGPGSLTALLAARVKQVVAVELDEQLAERLTAHPPADNVEVIRHDILRFDLTSLPSEYKIVANIPYYLSSNLIRVLSESSNPPKLAVLLMQKEVAERITAKPGDLSLLGVSAQFYWRVQAGQIIPASLFTPPPKVNSQIVKLTRRDEIFPDVDSAVYFRIVKAGFASKRKTLLNSLSSGLRLSKEEVLEVLTKAKIEPNVRAQNLTLEDWYRIYQQLGNKQGS